MDYATELLTEELNKILDEVAPVKVFQVRSNYAPWLSSATKTLMKERDQVYKLASESNLNNDWKKYKSLRNRVNTVVRSEKKIWQAKKLQDCSHDTSKTWKHVKSWLGWNSGGPPTQLMENGKLISKPRQLSDCMNTFFVKSTTCVRI